jgi:hypothetical protein
MSSTTVSVDTTPVRMGMPGQPVGGQTMEMSPGLTQRDVRRIEQSQGRIAKRLRVCRFHLRHQHLRECTGSARVLSHEQGHKRHTLNFLPLSRRRATNSDWPFTVDDERIWQEAGACSEEVRVVGQGDDSHLADIGEAALLVLEVQV